MFDEKTKKVAYTKQTQAVKGKSKSNCPLCAVGDNANKARIYDFDEMDADHVAAWSKGGDSSAKPGRSGHRPDVRLVAGRFMGYMS